MRKGKRQGMPLDKDVNGEGEAMNTQVKVTLQKHLIDCQ